MANNEYINVKVRLQDAQKFVSDTKKSSSAVDKLGKETKQSGKEAKTASGGYKHFTKEVNATTRAHRFGVGALKKAAVAAGGLAAAYIGISAAKDAVKTTVDLGASTLKLHRNFGMSIKSGSAWAAITREREVDYKQLNMAFTSLSRNTVSATQGSEKQRKAFRLLGVSTRDLHKGTKHFEPLLNKVIKGFGDLPGGVNRANLAQTLFGKGAGKLVPIFTKGQKSLRDNMNMAEKYGATFGSSTTDKVKNYIKAQRELRFAMMGLQLVVGTFLIPKLIKLMQFINKTVLSARQGKGIFGQFKTVIHAVGVVASGAAKWFGKHKDAAKVLGAVIVGLTTFLVAYKVGVMAVGVYTKIAAVVSGVWTAAQWLLNAALTANPIGLIVVGIAALIAGFVLAYKKVKWFRNAVNAVFNFVKKYWKFLILPLAPILAPIILIVSKFKWIKNAASNAFNWVKHAAQNFVSFFKKLPGRIARFGKGMFNFLKRAIMGPINFIRNAVTNYINFWKKMPGRLLKVGKGMFNFLKDAFKGAINWVIDKWNGIQFKVPKVDMGPLGSVGGFTIGVPDIPKLAKGGTITTAGAAVVGDVGPEVLNLPRGAEVRPLTRRQRGEASHVSPRARAALGNFMEDRPILLHSHVHIDGKEVATSVAKHVANKKARR